MPAAQAAFRERLRAREPLLGVFIKTPSPHATEIFGQVGFDFIVVDQEHAPFDRTATDLVLLAARAAGIAALVRVPSASPPEVLGALDDGAQGVVVPHVSSVALAKSVVASARYRNGNRGFSNSPRAGRYGAAAIWEHVATCDANTAVIAMLEDPQAVEAAGDIAAVDGLDALFIGRGDLTVALGASAPDSSAVRAAVEKIAASGLAHGKALCVHAGRVDAEEVQWLKSLGVNAFVVSSDQGLMRAAAVNVLDEFRKALPK